MSIIYPMRDAPASPPNWHRLPGTEGPEWISRLRLATEDAAGKASWRPDCTPDSTAELIIRQVQELHPGALLVLGLVTAILVRQSTR